ncbi:MAG: hypothetical protein ACRBBW_20815 [Cellvibrionaceae bacterium]
MDQPLINQTRLILLCALCWAFAIAGCVSTFEREAMELRAKMTYEENPADLKQREPLSAEKNWRGDCSNYAASFNHIEGVRIWTGKLKDGRSHAMACLNVRCADTVYPTPFDFNPDDWFQLWSLNP